MSAATFTPGPWQVTNGTDVFTLEGAARADGTKADPTDAWQVADCSTGAAFVDGELREISFFERRANVRLIAAAPLLLDALEAIVKSLADHDDEGMIEHAAQMVAARSAIAAARGQA